MSRKDKPVVYIGEEIRKELVKQEDKRLKEYIETQAQKWVDSVWDKQTKEMLRYKSDKK